MYALRLAPGEELMGRLGAFCQERGLRAAYIASCVGSVDQATIRLANADRDHPNEVKDYDKRFEIVSVVGTVSTDGAHVHVALSDSTGRCVGGHLISATVFTTAEVVLGTVQGVRFAREYDHRTGFKELVVKREDDDDGGGGGDDDAAPPPVKQELMEVALLGCALVVSCLSILRSLRRLG